MASPTNERIDELMKTLKTKSGKMNWKVVVEIVKELKPFQQQGFKPSLRTMFYRLYSKGVLPNNEYNYNHLSKVTAEARMDRRLPINCFSDSNRNIIANFSQKYQTLDEIIDEYYLNELKNLPETYPKIVPRWYKQPHYVEVWIEKEAMAGTFQSILEDINVVIVPNKGFTSLTFLRDNMKRLDKWTSMGAILEDIKAGGDGTGTHIPPRQESETKNIHILYFGDFDPSGEEMDRDLENRVNQLYQHSHTYIKFEDLDFQRIAVTKEQIEQYDLPIDIDAPTQEKLEKDKNTEGFIERHGQVYAVELDALPAIVPDEFREMVLDSVERYFYEDIYEDNTMDYSEYDAKNLIKQKLKQFLQKY